MDTRKIFQQSAAVFTAGAALIHFGVAGEHFAQWWLYGIFFLVLAAWQLAWSVLCWQSARRWLLVAGIVVNIGVVVLWTITRSTGLPFGPTPGVAEAVGVPDVLSAVLELASVGLSVAVLLQLHQSAPGRQWGARSATTAVAAVATLVLVATGVAIADPGDAHSSSDAMAVSAASGSSSGAMATGNGERHQMSQLPDVAGATPSQTAAAQGLLTATIADTAKYRDAAAATAAGFDVQAAAQKYEQRHPHASGKAIKMLHVPNKANRKDGKLLDPMAPETLIYNRSIAGEFTLIGVMYTAEKQSPPAQYLPYLRWHYHQLCKGKGKAKAMPSSGTCPAGSTMVKTGYMTHVWFVQPSKLVYAFAMSVPKAQVKAYQLTLK